MEANPTNGGTVTGGGQYDAGATCNLHAEPATNYQFDSWKKDGIVVSNNPDYSFVVTESATYIAYFTQALPTQYTITVSANPNNGGSVEGGGTYNNGQSCTVTATPATGFTFLRWTENGNQVSTNASYTFTVTSNRTLIAQFQAQSYTINASANPSNGGTVSGGGTYNYGQNCTLTATPATGFTFLRWTENGNQVSTNASYTFTVTGNRTLVAQFQAQSFTITASANPSNGGTVTGSGTYNYGQSCTLTAAAATGYTFLKWTENGNQVSTNASYTFTVTSNRTLIAQFQAQEFTITASANPSNGGTVSGGGTYNYGQNCNLIATAKPGFTFTNWTENGSVVSNNANYTFTVTGNRTLVANFDTQAPNTYNINVSPNPSNGGTVSGGGTYNYGQSCTVTATPATGFTFLRWTENGQQVSTNASYTFTVTGDRTLVAQFQAQSFTITATANPSNGGTVTGGGTYNYGQNCTLTATPATGFTFLRWTENGNQVSTNASYTFTVTGNRTLVAQFQAQSYTITASANPSNGGTVTGGGTYNYGQSCTLTATAATGFTFLRWTENGNQVSTNASYTFTVTSNRTLIAQFQAQSFNITVSANPSEGGTVAGGGTYSYGQNCTVTATPNEGYTFEKWTKNNVQVSTNPSYTFTVTESAAYVAHFSLQQCTIKVSANPDEGGTVYIGDNPGQTQGTFTNGQRCMVHADANTGYSFVKWTENGVQVSINADYDFIVDSNRDLVAHFTQQEYIITAEADPVVGGTIEGTGGYDYGEECTLVATANDGYDFINWTKEGEQVSTRPNYTFNVTESATYVAHFQLKQFVITAVVDPENGGTVIGEGTYGYGQNCTLIAVPTEGFAFVNWTKEDGEPVSANDSCQFTVTEDLTLVAHFAEQSYTITAIINPAEGGSVDGTGTHSYGEPVTLKARANPGYAFVNWEDENGNQISTDPTMFIIVTGDRTFVANFQGQQQNYSIHTLSDPDVGGNVSVSQNEAPQGTVITITITENLGFELDTITVYNTDNPSQTVQVTNNELNYEFTMPNYSVTVKAEFKQQEIDTPAPICSGESLDLDELVLPWFPPGYWQLSPTEDFAPGSTIIYTNQALDASYDGWYLRYHVEISVYEWNSDVVQITVHSLAEMTLQGEDNVSLDQEVEYMIVIEDQNNNADYSINWSVSDGQADVTILDNSCKVTWKTTGTQQVSVTVTDETTGCTKLLVMDVNVTACIDNLQEIVAKDHKEGSETYVLILVYPNPNNEDYSYQWLYSSDGEIYHELTEGTAKKQYYYKGGRLKDGYYKVRISKDGCSEETLPYHVNYGGRLHIYPNPSHRGTGVVVVNDSDSPAQLTIYSTDGRVLHTQIVTSDQATIGINLPQGVYVAYLTTGDGYTKIGKLIIQ